MEKQITLYTTSLKIICRCRWVLIGTVFMLLCSAQGLAKRTDVVVLGNGDTITGEIKKLERGRLQYKTDDMGTIYIEWDKIARITSKDFFEIELTTGQRFFGSMEETSEKGRMHMVSTLLDITLDMSSVVLITPLKATFWSRLNGFIDLGFSYTKADRLTTWTGSGEVNHRSRKHHVKVHGSSYLSHKETEDSTTRNTLGIQFYRFFGKRWSYMGLGKLEQNTELGLNLRSSVGGGVTRNIIQTNRINFLVMAGAVFSRERFIDEDDVTNSAEAMGAVQFELFQYDDPKVDITADFAVFPSMTLLGRFRTSFNTRLQIEFFKDFFWSLTYFDNYDSDPQTVGDKDLTKHDYGITTGIGWSFN